MYLQILVFVRPTWHSIISFSTFRMRSFQTKKTCDSILSASVTSGYNAVSTWIRKTDPQKNHAPSPRSNNGCQMSNWIHLFFGRKNGKNHSKSHHLGVSKNRGTPKMDGLWWKTLLKWMIWGYHYFWKHPYISMWHFEVENIILSHTIPNWAS